MTEGYTHPLRRAEDFIPEVCKVTHDEVERRLEALEQAVELLKTRPPVWATFVMAGLSAGCGALLSHIITLGPH